MVIALVASRAAFFCSSHFCNALYAAAVQKQPVGSLISFLFFSLLGVVLWFSLVPVFPVFRQLGEDLR